MKRLAEWSVKNSLLVNLLSVFIIFTGLTAVFSLRREAFPNFSFDIVEVVTRYPGSTPSQVEKLITIPIEKELKEVDDIKEMISLSAEGFSYIYLTIEPDAKNKDRIVNEIQRAVDRTEDLPEDLEDLPVVKEISTKNSPLIEVAVSGNLSREMLRRETLRLETALLNDPNVAKVIRRGYREPEFSVEVNPQKMERYHLSLTDIMQALKNTNINIPGGTVVEAGKEYLLRVTGEFFTPREIEEVIVRSNDRGFHVKVKDVAVVVPTLEELTISNRSDGSEAINLLVLKKEKGDILELVDDIQKIIADFKTKAPPELNVAIINDISFYVRRRLDVLINNGLIGLGLVMIPLILFLSPRTALSAFIGIPTAVMAAFALMSVFDITINLMSLFGMIMVIGMLVDEDVVVAENVHRYLEMGLPAREAAIRGSSQVTRAVIATVLTTITAFLPLMFMTGIIGKFVKQIPQVVIITLAASLLQALVILPSHISDLYRMSESKTRKLVQKYRHSHLIDRMIEGYGRLLERCLRYRYLLLATFVLGMAGIAWLGLAKVPYIIFPKRGIEQFFIRVEGEIGTPVEVTTERMKPIEQIIKKLPASELDHFTTQGGITQNDPTDPFTERYSHVGQIWIFLTPEPGRERKAGEIIEALRPEVEKVPGFKRVYFEWVRAGPPVGKPVAIRLKGDDFKILDALSQEYIRYLKTIPGVTDIKSDYQWGKEELKAVIDEELMKQAGLSHQEVATAIRVAFDGGVASTIKESDEEIDVVVRFPEGIRDQKDSLKDLLISNREGRMIPLKAIAAFQPASSLAVIKHEDRKRLISVTANVDEKITTSRKVNAQVAKHFESVLPKYPGVLVKYGGEEEDTQESLQNLFRSFILAVFLTFIIIAATFRSLWEPLVILLTLPMGGAGVIVGFYLSGEPLTFLAMLGVVGFAGVVVDGAILMVDFINHERERGKSFREAIILGAKARLRPIILTTLTTVLGIVPAAFGIGGTDPFIQPMAYAMNWGLSVGTLLAIFLIPVLLAILGDWIPRFKKLAHIPDSQPS